MPKNTNSPYIGKRYGHLVLLERGPELIFRTSHQSQWLCECDCGQKLLASIGKLRVSPRVSCGCFNFKETHGNQKHTPQESSWIGLFTRNQHAARKRGLSWDLSLGDFIEITSRPCVWCHNSPEDPFNAAIGNGGYSQVKHVTSRVTSGWIRHNGLDRIDNSKGYTRDNVQSSCKYCNFARNDRSPEDFLDWLRHIARIYIER